MKKEGAKIHNRIVISEKIVEFRRANKITQSEFGRLIGVSPQAVYKWEKEICYPDITMLPVIASLVGCGINDFFV
ncbi:MAG: helix-turn-helix transcriptional regulator [Clostridia bacterium]|nr:helix-turn-helix transcriptional regulator [Clostridia bacterium]